MPRQDDKSLQLFVDRLLLRSDLNAEEQQAILNLPVHRVAIKARHDVVRIAEETTSACLIASGLVGRFGQTVNGARQITAFHTPGDMADLHSAVRPVGVGGLVALADTVIERVPHLAMRTLAARFPAIAEALWRDCIVDAAILMEWVVNVGRRDARTRVAHILCEMAVRLGADRQPKHDYAFPVTQEQLGDAAGLTAVHVNRTLKALGGMATVRSGRVQIHDWAAMAATGEFNPSYLVADTAPARQMRLLAA